MSFGLFHLGKLWHSARITYEQLPDEWKAWLDPTPLERFRRSEELFAQ